MPTDFTATSGGDGIFKATAFQTGAGVSAPLVVVSTTITFDPPSLTTGAFAESSDIVITGVALGDIVELYPPYDTQGIMYQASPASAGNITISLTSCASGTVDLSSGTWGVVVKRRV
jgi:hypothetical protein